MPPEMTMKKFSRLVTEIMRPLRNRVMMTIARGVIESVDDSKKMQLVKLSLLPGEVRDKVERFQNYGFSGNPPANTECAVIFVSGNREHGMVVGCDDRATRFMGLAEGESVQYNKNGKKIHLKENDELEIKLDKFKVENSTAELIDLLIQLATALEIEPFIVNKAVFTALRVKLESFKV